MDNRVDFTSVLANELIVHMARFFDPIEYLRFSYTNAKTLYVLGTEVEAVRLTTKRLSLTRYWARSVTNPADLMMGYLIEYGTNQELLAHMKFVKTERVRNLLRPGDRRTNIYTYDLVQRTTLFKWLLVKLTLPVDDQDEEQAARAIILGLLKGKLLAKVTFDVVEPEIVQENFVEYLISLEHSGQFVDLYGTKSLFTDYSVSINDYYTYMHYFIRSLARPPFWEALDLAWGLLRQRNEVQYGDDARRLLTENDNNALAILKVYEEFNFQQPGLIELWAALRNGYPPLFMTVTLFTTEQVRDILKGEKYPDWLSKGILENIAELLPIYQSPLFEPTIELREDIFDVVLNRLLTFGWQPGVYRKRTYFQLLVQNVVFELIRRGDIDNIVALQSVGYLRNDFALTFTATEPRLLRRNMPFQTASDKGGFVKLFAFLCPTIESFEKLISLYDASSVKIVGMGFRWDMMPATRTPLVASFNPDVLLYWVDVTPAEQAKTPFWKVIRSTIVSKDVGDRSKVHGVLLWVVGSDPQLAYHAGFDHILESYADTGAEDIFLLLAYAATDAMRDHPVHELLLGMIARNDSSLENVYGNEGDIYNEIVLDQMYENRRSIVRVGEVLRNVSVATRQKYAGPSGRRVLHTALTTAFNAFTGSIKTQGLRLDILQVDYSVAVLQQAEKDAIASIQQIEGDNGGEGPSSMQTS